MSQTKRAEESSFLRTEKWLGMYRRDGKYRRVPSTTMNKSVSCLYTDNSPHSSATTHAISNKELPQQASNSSASLVIASWHLFSLPFPHYWDASLRCPPGNQRGGLRGLHFCPMFRYLLNMINKLSQAIFTSKNPCHGTIMPLGSSLFWVVLRACLDFWSRSQGRADPLDNTDHAILWGCWNADRTDARNHGGSLMAWLYSVGSECVPALVDDVLELEKHSWLEDGTQCSAVLAMTITHYTI